MAQPLKWKRVHFVDPDSGITETHYVSGEWRLEPVVGSNYYQWFLMGSPSNWDGLLSFRTLRQAKTEIEEFYSRHQLD